MLIIENGNMIKEKVSVIVPTFNQSQYLGACLDSIYFQDHANLEIIIVNDCSTDKTNEILNSYTTAIDAETVSFAAYYNESNHTVERKVYPRYRKTGRTFKIINNRRNLGSTRTYNIGFKAVTGKYCTYVASDDICHPQMISTLVQPLENDIADFVYSDMFIIDDANRILREFKLPDYTFDACFGDWYLCGVSKLYRRELHEELGYYNENYLANDHELYLSFAMNGVRFKHIPQVLYSVRSHENREENVHSPGNWSRLLEESCGLVRKARLFQTKEKE